MNADVLALFALRHLFQRHPLLAPISSDTMQVDPAVPRLATAQSAGSKYRLLFATLWDCSMKC